MTGGLAGRWPEIAARFATTWMRRNRLLLYDDGQVVQGT
jgi:hypothetical protein